MARPKLTEHQKSMLKRLGENLRAARQQAGLTQEALGDLIGSDRDYVGEVERGSINMSATRLIETAWALGITPADLMAGIEPPGQ